MQELIITEPAAPALETLCDWLRSRAEDLERSGGWPSEQWEACRRAGVTRWFAPTCWGGFGWSDESVFRAFHRLAGACLSTTFSLTQPAGVIRRIVDGENTFLQERVLPELVQGEAFASVGVAHLTTSRRHLTRPLLTAVETSSGFRLKGQCPWVTGGIAARWVITGAVLEDGRQLLVVLPTDLPGVECDPPAAMLALTSTQTGSLRCAGVELSRDWVLAGPVEQVMAGGRGASTGSLQTSVLALGLASAAIDFLAHEAESRGDLRSSSEPLREEHDAIWNEVLAAARGTTPADPESVRSRANWLVLRSTQAALTAAKGAGFLQGHPVGRWCREALFFLVWSCPQPVASATLCRLTGRGE